MPRTLILALSLSLSFLVVSAPTEALAQAPSREEQYDEAFRAGLQLLTVRKIDESIRAFNVCVRIFPNRAVSYYNLACAFSLKKDETRAVAYLRKSFEKGFKDVAHMRRDMDLQPIRRTPAFRKAMAEFSENVLSDIEVPLTHIPATVTSILVYVPDVAGDPEKDLESLRTAFPSWAILIPRGPKDPQRGSYFWDQRGEFIVAERLRGFLREHKVEAKNVLVAAEGSAGQLALMVAANNPDLVGGALAAGSNLHAAIGDADLSGTRAYLVVHERNPRQIAAGTIARNAFAKAKSPVVLERYKLDKPFSKDRALLLRGIAWLQGKQVTLPGSGKEQEF
jgi:tetratricopeptide (TPR) repeat protein